MKRYYNLIKYQLRKKNNFLVAVIISLLISVIFLLNTYQKSWNNYLQTDIYEQLVFRSLQVFSDTSSEEEKVQLENISHIINVVPMSEYRSSVSIQEFPNENNKTINIFSANNESIPEIVEGTNFPDNDGYYMICPINFYPYVYEEELRSSSKNQKVDLVPYVNEYLNLKYYGNLYVTNKNDEYIFNTKVQLVGLYKNSNYSVDENTCYVNEKTMNEMILNKYKDDQASYEFQKNNGFIINIDNVNNVNLVSNELTKLGFEYQEIAFIDTETVNYTNSNINLAIVVISVLVFVFIFLMLKRDFKEDRQYYILLYKVGYNKSVVKKVYLFSMIIKVLIYYISLILISELLFGILNIVLKYFPYLFIKFKLLFSYKYLLISIIILAINVLLNLILNFKRDVFND